MLQVPITALFGSALAIVNVALAANVSRARAKTNIFLGTGDSPELLRAVRRHGNNAESVPLGLVTMMLVELNAGASKALYGFGAALLVSRLIHAVVIDVTPNALRSISTVLTWGAIGGLGVYAGYLSMP
jgi:hypothetical protein